MRGADGNDIYIVNSTQDVIVEHATNQDGTGTGGYDAVETTANYTLSANIEKLKGKGTGNISLTGNSSNNLIIGNSGNNTLKGEGGIDTLQGGRGDDTYVIGDSGDVVEEIDGQSDGNDEVQTTVNYTLSSRVEILRSMSSQGLVLTGNNDAIGNKIYGNSGRDTLNGGVDTAVDTLTGGLGNDVYQIDSDVHDIVDEKAGEGDADEVVTSVSYALTSNVENLTASGNGNIALTGNGGANTITGNSGNNVIDGGDGADTMNGKAGNDTYHVNDVNDKVIEAAGSDQGTNDTIITTINYSLDPDVYVETLKASGRADQQINLAGNAESNTLIGHSGANILNGGAGADRMEGGDGDDVYYVDNAGDVVIDTGGNDTVHTNRTTELSANDQIEHLTAAEGAADPDGTGIDFKGSNATNKLTGNELSNRLDGGAGDDILDGKGGADIMEGGLVLQPGFVRCLRHGGVTP
jgi:Ca2+-binding RTX toxin-like protein